MTAPRNRSGLEAAVVDVDGTLVDSNYHLTLAWFRAFRAAGHPAPAWRIHRHMGMGGDKLVAAVAGDDVEEQSGETIREIWEREYDDMLEQVPLLAGARDLLDGIQERGLEVVLASSGLPHHTRHALQLLDAERRSDAWTTSEDAEETKPDPELLEVALSRVQARHAVVLGDSVWDVLAAKGCDLPTITLLTGGFSPQELRESGATAIYTDPEDLLANLDQALAEVTSPKA